MAAAQISCEYCLLRTQWQALLPRLNLSAGTRASNEGYPKVCEDFTITEKAPTRAFSWLKMLLALSHLRHYAKQVLKHSE